MPFSFTRRKFVAVLGLSFFSTEIFHALARAKEAAYASPYKNKEGGYGLAFLNKTGKLLSSTPLPARGHGMALGKNSGRLVVFARRPGNFAMVLNTHGKQAPFFFASPQGTHFYGHGVFSSTEKLLFATENAYEDGKGLVGVYDAENNFKRLGSFSSGGVGPHELLLMPDNTTLCVANGGIETHPDTGRTKLNLHRMQSSVAFLDSKKGAVLQKFNVPPPLQRLSLRHMALDHQENLWLGGQYEGFSMEDIPLIACVNRKKGLVFPAFKKGELLSLANYVGSVSSDAEGKKVAFSSPKGNILLVLDVNKKLLLSQQTLPQVCGVAKAERGFFTTSLSGTSAQVQHPLFWDNHLMAL